jgi:hypothetical protein
VHMLEVRPHLHFASFRELTFFSLF